MCKSTKSAEMYKYVVNITKQYIIENKLLEGNKLNTNLSTMNGLIRGTNMHHLKMMIGHFPGDGLERSARPRIGHDSFYILGTMVSLLLSLSVYVLMTA
jgi:hypothetical protein